MKLTQPQLGLMARAYELKRHHGADGVYPRGGQRKSLLRLEEMGLMRFVGFGTCIDGEVEGEKPIWELTDDGLKVLMDLGEVGHQP